MQISAACGDAAAAPGIDEQRLYLQSMRLNADFDGVVRTRPVVWN